MYIYESIKFLIIFCPVISDFVNISKCIVNILCKYRMNSNLRAYAHRNKKKNKLTHASHRHRQHLHGVLKINLQY